MKSYGLLIWDYANGIEDSEVRKSNYISMKGAGNSTIIIFDVENKETAYKVLLALCETIGMTYFLSTILIYMQKVREFWN